jgi:hypothetical protein
LLRSSLPGLVCPQSEDIETGEVILCFYVLINTHFYSIDTLSFVFFSFCRVFFPSSRRGRGNENK